MISVSAVLALVFMHFVADFLLQTEKMASNKSTSNKWLAIHVTVYSIPFLIFGFWFAVANFILHITTDYFSSRATKALLPKARATNNYHWFFAVIGLDQAIHMTSLVLTYVWLVA